ncbi:ATP-dependent (S)-NAD(P)H-hydrate dehydratase [Strongylocentrotus purpuratus]|uniref:ATP-dependent (S)-NAD(P)H-hydrate dehydratase n=1 Tax=Strongylocentrotus purpuratus TaxID=7668 RepID=A0A7M7NHP5_STRPU|nr:ATP-dependent (S)-NAD(P)H-hydrate dehydratase [Strongylocentrotus purpuratus]XP_030836567.1 ATP-dependent (S)-NAD(P)H-hydrate dehydratase [Strongylocentrotus purpuratus]|eukprot:XP_011668093.1 PREDICTED: ATP-dependent (S)-NAD(P)H-hydrate dehydratase [Strongylocentrotus purpuratus]
MLKMFTVQTILCQLINRARPHPSAKLSTGGDNVITTLTDGGHMIEMVRSIVPSLDFTKHKGQDGRIATIGGCREYTGAPYFAAISAFRVGCDLSHVFCTDGAGPVIKSYSPELIVHPCLDAEDGVEEMKKWLPRMHSVVIGPGLGRDQKLLDKVKIVITEAKELDLPLVIDADGVFLLTQAPDLIRDYRQAILTPNVVEFKHLFKSVVGSDVNPAEPQTDVMELSRSLGHVTVCMKGANDIISDGHNVLVCCGEGSPRRCGGQGDILAGTMGVFTFWAHQAVLHRANIKNEYLKIFGPTLCAAYGACLLTKRCSSRAFEKNGRGMTTTEMLPEIQPVFANLYETSE